MLRVMGGAVRGRKLHSPKGLRFRPTTGRVKEFIFSYLGDIIKDTLVLDVFSGTGSLGIEALSRGAERIHFVEKDPINIPLISKNLEISGFHNRGKIWRGDFFTIAEKICKKVNQFDIIIADPPFHKNLQESIVTTVRDAHLLKERGLLIIEHDLQDTASVDCEFQLIKQRRFGYCSVSVYGR